MTGRRCARCYELNSGCQGAATGNGEANNCYPFDLWSGSKTGVYYQEYGLSGGSMGYGANSCGTGMYGKCVLSYAFSVRCVLDLGLGIISSGFLSQADMDS